MSRVVLDVKNLSKYFPIKKGKLGTKKEMVRAVDNVSLRIYEGETLGIVGESGCGKTTLGKCLVRLLMPTAGEISLWDEGSGQLKNVLKLSRKESFAARRRLQIVFQDPYSALNPMKNVLTAFDEPMRIHGLGDKAERFEIASRMMLEVNLRPEYLSRYPHEFSGGQLQRICIAKSLAMSPEVIVCDEPVSALDVSIQAQTLNLMRRLQRDFNLTYVFIAHDLSVVQYMSSRVAVMYLGQVVELAPSRALSDGGLHPYTQALLSAVPIPRLGARKDRILLEGDVPSPANPPSGCRFHPRCRYCMEICRREIPKLQLHSDTTPEKTGEHWVACHLYD